MAEHFKIAIVGAGRVGTALGRALAARGHTIDAVVCSTRAHARQAVRRLGAGRPAVLDQIGTDVELVLITTPDRIIEKTAEELASLHRGWRGITVLHCSGFLAATALRSLRRKGAWIGSLHPLQTFTREDSSLEGIYFFLQGDPHTTAVMRSIVRQLGGRSCLLPQRHKPLYHCAASMACGHLLALLELSAGLFRKIRIPPAALRPLVDRTLDHYWRDGFRASLTGPVARGDRRILQGHLEQLRRIHPAYAEVYRQLTRVARAKLSPRGSSRR